MMTDLPLISKWMNPIHNKGENMSVEGKQIYRIEASITGEKTKLILIRAKNFMECLKKLTVTRYVVASDGAVVNTQFITSFKHDLSETSETDLEKFNSTYGDLVKGVRSEQL